MSHFPEVDSFISKRGPSALEVAFKRLEDAFLAKQAAFHSLVVRAQGRSPGDAGTTNTVTTVLSQVNIDALTFQLGVPPSPFAAALCQEPKFWRLRKREATRTDNGPSGDRPGPSSSSGRV